LGVARLDVPEDMLGRRRGLLRSRRSSAMPHRRPPPLLGGSSMPLGVVFCVNARARLPLGGGH
ncbi:hypothetical protein Dimus_012801, partial [Dionaea muscipula]